MTDNPSPTWLDEAQARCDAATEGPWYASPLWDGRSHVAINGAMDLWHSPGGTIYRDRDKSDAEFIAHARTDLPRALSELRAARQERDDALQTTESCSTLQQMAAACIEGAMWKNKCAALESSLAQAQQERDAAPKMFPVMGDKCAPGPFNIPWSIAEKACGAYAVQYGRRQSLERVAERGGFYWGELDDLYPQWRDETSEIVALRKALAQAQRQHSLDVVAYDELARDLERADAEVHELWQYAPDFPEFKERIKKGVMRQTTIDALSRHRSRQSSQKAEASTGSV